MARTTSAQNFQAQSSTWKNTILWLESLYFLPPLSDRKLCHSISKLIGDEEDTLKSFMAFNITPRGLVFRVVVGSQIVVSPTIPPSQWHTYDSNPWTWLWYHLLDCKLCHSTSKPIGDEEDTLKSFIAFDIKPGGPVFRVVVRSQILVSQQL